jgi:diketogulonate reductase-like aldo/keto reductase
LFDYVLFHLNQYICSPLYPQHELLQYCKGEGITLQAYASLGGQDLGKKGWVELFGWTNPTSSTIASSDGKAIKAKKEFINLLSVQPVLNLAQLCNKSPAQILLRWAIDQGVPIIPKTTSINRMQENANIFDFQLSEGQIQQLTIDIQQQLLNQEVNDNNDTNFASVIPTRLCWRNDPLRLLDFP